MYPISGSFQETFPEAEFVDISSMFVLARSVKAEDEIQMFRTLCRIADEGFYQVSRMVRPGVREREMADCFRQSVIATGFCVPSSWSMFSCFGSQAHAPGGRNHREHPCGQI
ncbi:MAG: hypothetical protein ACLTBV_25345 [Enterocloster bolteae]